MSLFVDFLKIIISLTLLVYSYTDNYYLKKDLFIAFFLFLHVSAVWKLINHEKTFQHINVMLLKLFFFHVNVIEGHTKDTILISIFELQQFSVLSLVSALFRQIYLISHITYGNRPHMAA